VVSRHRNLGHCACGCLAARHGRGEEVQAQTGGLPGVGVLPGVDLDRDLDLVALDLDLGHVHYLDLVLVLGLVLHLGRVASLGLGVVRDRGRNLGLDHNSLLAGWPLGILDEGGHAYYRVAFRLPQRLTCRSCGEIAPSQAHHHCACFDSQRASSEKWDSAVP